MLRFQVLFPALVALIIVGGCDNQRRQQSEALYNALLKVESDLTHGVAESTLDNDVATADTEEKKLARFYTPEKMPASVAQMANARVQLLHARDSMFVKQEKLAKQELALARDFLEHARQSLDRGN